MLVAGAAADSGGAFGLVRGGRASATTLLVTLDYIFLVGI